MVVAGMAVWHFTNREEIGPTFGADVEALTTQEQVQVGVASRFTFQVQQDNKDTPLQGRVMDIAVTPADKAKIISVSGQSGRNYAKDASRAKGRTDAEGKLDVMVSAEEPGKYTLVALDSASNKEGTVNFQVVAPGG